MRLNVFLAEKCEGVRELLKESVCEFQGDFPNLACVDRKYVQRGVEGVGKRLEQELQGDLLTQKGWSTWELVKVGKSSQMEKVKKTCVFRSAWQSFCMNLIHCTGRVAGVSVAGAKGKPARRLGDCNVILHCNVILQRIFFASFKTSPRVLSGHTDR